MVYGFDNSASFGKFFPDADMPGYWEHLEQRFNEMSANGTATHEFFHSLNRHSSMTALEVCYR